MRLNTQFHGIEVHESLRKVIDRKIEKLRRRFPEYQDETVWLTVSIEKAPRKYEFVCDLTLKVPRKVLRASRSAEDLSTAVTTAFDALILDSEKLKVQMNRAMRRRRRLERSEQQGVEPSAEEIFSTARQVVFTGALRERLGPLYNFARREILQSQLAGDLQPGDIVPVEVVDEAIANVFSGLQMTVPEKEIERLLYAEVWKILRREVDEVKESRERWVSLEKAVEDETAVEPEGTLTGDLFEYWQPEEVLRVEDVIPDSTFPSQEQVMEDEEIQKVLMCALSTLPAKERGAFVLNDVEGFQSEEISLILGTPVEAIESTIEGARAKVREALASACRKITDANLREWYGALSRLPYSEEVERHLRELLNVQQNPA